MEEILCIGCGATIQTTDKNGLGFTPQSALEKRFGKLVKFIVNVVSVFVITMKSQMCN